MDISQKKLIMVVQCDETVRKVCPGFICENAFQQRQGGFARYPADIHYRYLSMSCGGCPGRASLRKLMYLKKRLAKKADLVPENVVVHLSSCITRENHHGPRCPHINYIKTQIATAGFDCVEDSYISANAEKKRDANIYKR